MLAAACCLMATFSLAAGPDAYKEPDVAQRLETAKQRIESHVFQADEGFLALVEQRIAEGTFSVEMDPEALASGIDCGIPSCTGSMSEKATYGSWVDNGNTRTCPYNWRLLDYQQTRSVIYDYICNRCGYGFTYTDTQDRWVCGH